MSSGRNIEKVERQKNAGFEPKTSCSPKFSIEYEYGSHTFDRERISPNSMNFNFF